MTDTEFFMKFELLFISGVQFCCFTRECPFFPTVFTKHTVFPSHMSCVFWSKISWTSLTVFISMFPTVFYWSVFILMTHGLVACRGALTQPPGPPWMKNKSTKTWSAWGGEVANLSKEKGPEPFPPGAFIRFFPHRNADKAHQSLSASKD